MSGHAEFDLHFYAAQPAAIARLIERARQAHPHLVDFTERVASRAAAPCIRITLQFRDGAALARFMDDEAFREAYLAAAWGGGPLPRAALLEWPPRASQAEPVESALFSAVGI